MSEVKACSTCREIKPATLAYFSYRQKGDNKKWRSQCRKCAAASSRQWAIRNPDSRRAYDAGWRAANRARINAARRKKYWAHHAQASAAAKKWVMENPDKVGAIRRRFKAKNRVALSKKEKERYQNNPEYRAVHLCRRIVRRVFFGSAAGKPASAMRMLGLPISEYLKWLEQKFEPWMTWENRGKQSYGGPQSWAIDHVIPLRGAVEGTYIFRLSELEDIKIAFNYRNTVPLESMQNCRKSDKVPHWDDLPPDLQNICTPRIKELLQKVQKTA